MDLVFLGTGAGNGVPTFYCDCPVCAEAQGAVRCRRTRSAVAVLGEKNYVIDAPPEISSQLLRENITGIDGVFLTHAHHDHSSGLGDLEIYARYHLRGRLPAVMTLETLEQLQQSHGSLADWLDITVIEPGHAVCFSGVEYTCLKVSHFPGTAGYLIRHDNFRLAYIPDSGPLPEHTMSVLHGIDCLALDATFHGENMYPGQHLEVRQTIAIAQELKVKKLYLTHLSMHYSEPVTSEQLELDIAKYDGLVNLAYDGLRMTLAGT